MGKIRFEEPFETLPTAANQDFQLIKALGELQKKYFALQDLQIELQQQARYLKEIHKIYGAALIAIVNGQDPTAKQIAMIAIDRAEDLKILSADLVE